MRLSRNALVAIALVAGTALLANSGFAADSSAAGAGSRVLAGIQGAVTGNIGLFVGLALAILGIWTWVVKQETAAGIMLIIGGVLITIAPGVFNTLADVVGGVVKTTGQDLTSVKNPSGLTTQ